MMMSCTSSGVPISRCVVAKAFSEARKYESVSVTLTSEYPSQLQAGEIVGVIAKSDGLTTHQEAMIIDSDECVTQAYINEAGVSKTKSNRVENRAENGKKKQVLEGYVYQILMSERIGRYITMLFVITRHVLTLPPPPPAPG